jgi:cell division protein FtsQ
MRQDVRAARGRAPSRGNIRPALRPEEISAHAASRALKRKKHRRRVLAVFYLCLFLAVLGTAAALSLHVLFRITEISVTGTSRYTEQQIIAASGIKTGDNLFLVATKDDAQAIRRRLPYIGSVKVTRKFPTSVQIAVQSANVLGAAACGNSYVILGSDGTVLETTSSQPENCASFQGLKFKKAQVGYPVEFSDQEQESVFNSVMEAVGTVGLGKITSADFSSTTRIRLVYDGRVTVDLGTPTDLDYKLKFAKELLANNIKSTEKGTLNMTTTPDNNRAYFDPDYSPSSSLTTEN